MGDKDINISSGSFMAESILLVMVKTNSLLIFKTLTLMIAFIIQLGLEARTLTCSSKEGSWSHFWGQFVFEPTSRYRGIYLCRIKF